MKRISKALVAVAVVVTALCAILTGVVGAVGGEARDAGTANRDEASVVTGTTVSLEDKTFTIDGTSYTVTPIVYFPSGRAERTNRLVVSDAGKYTIEYLGFDYVGNCAKKTVEIEVLAAAKPVSIVFDEQSVADGAIRLDKTRPASADLFAKTKLPEAAATGVSGTAEKEISVKFGGEYVSVEDGAFIPFAEGIYTATYKFSDALKNVYLFDYEIEVSFTGKAVLTPVVLEKYMLDGSRYKLPAVSYSLANRYGEKIGTAETYIKIRNKDTGEVLKEYGGGKARVVYFTELLAEALGVKD